MKQLNKTFTAWRDLIKSNKYLTPCYHRWFFDNLNKGWLEKHNPGNMSCVVHRYSLWVYHPEMGWQQGYFEMSAEEKERCSHPLPEIPF